MTADFSSILTWWFTILILSLPNLPLVLKLFPRFIDRGYIFSKYLSLGLITYVLLTFGVFSIIPFTSTSVFLIMVIFSVINYLLVKNDLASFTSSLKSNLKTIFFQEALFLLVLALWSYVRGFSPDIEGLEKFMDWGFVNSALRSRYFPPADMWFSGHTINYYYFGHLIFALITKISGLSSAITYNLSIATVCSLTFVSGFSFSTNLVASLLSKINFKNIVSVGLVSALILTFGGNLHSVYKIGKIIKTNNNGSLVLTKAEVTKAALSYWYPDATRFIGFDPDIKDKTIHEFPIYSFVVADLHGHMNGIPFVILIMAFLFSYYQGIIFPSTSVPKLKTRLNRHSKTPTASFFSVLKPQIFIPLGFFLSLAYMTNAWDFAVYGLVFGLSYLAAHLYQLYQNPNLFSLKDSVKAILANGIAVIVAWYLFTLPFSANFTPMAEGLRLSDSHTPFYQLFILYGGFWLISFPFLITVVYYLLKKSNIKPTQILSFTDFFVFSLIVTATILIIIPEIGYIKDIYIYEHRRANTMFKLVYQAFIIYSLCSGYILYRLTTLLSARFLNISYRLLFCLVFTIHLIYPYFAIKSYYGLLETYYDPGSAVPKTRLKKYQGLWGLNFLKTQFPDNLKAIDWINQNIQGQPIMLEAVGDSYTTYNQVSTTTGLPTVQGWVVHEWLWRGGYDQPSARATDVEKIYQSTNEAELRQLLQKYNVDYIFVGDKEREKYKQLNEANFSNIGALLVFQSNQTRIYKLPK